MPRSTYQRLLGWVGIAARCSLILGFLVLPAAVVTIAAFNDKRDPVVSAADLVVALVRPGPRL